jgi:hypothetical protein
VTRRQRWARAGFAILVAGVAVRAAVVLTTPTPAIESRGRKTILFGNFADGAPIGQTFRMLSDGLNAVEVQLASEIAAAVTIRYRLMGWDAYAGGWTALYQHVAARDLPAGRSWQRFEFPPILASDRKVFFFQIQQMDAHAIDSAASAPPPKIAVVGFEDDAIEDGNLILGREQLPDRDLAFRAGSADSPFARYARGINRYLPDALQRPRIQWIVLAMYGLTLAVFAYLMVFGASPERRQ